MNEVNKTLFIPIYGIDDIESITNGLNVRFKAEHSLTPMRLVEELKSFEKVFFKLLFTGSGSFYGKIYRLLEFDSVA